MSMAKVKLPLPPQTPSLHAPDAQGQAARRAALATKQAEYRLSSQNALGIPLLVLPVPEAEVFSSRYEFGRGAATLPMVTNEALALRQIQNPFAPLQGLAAYEQLHVTIPRPDVILSWLTDETFGEQRLSGLNPGVVQRADRDGDLGSFDVPALKKALAQDPLPYPLFLIDHSKSLDKVGGGKVSIPGVGELPKFCPKPVALFRWCAPKTAELPSAKAGRFLPLAIQLKTSKGTTILTPSSPALLWTIAKVCFSIADANVHEMVTHLGRHHFALEAFGAVTPRQLAPQHPLHILLAPHLRFLLWNNQQGVERLIQEGGPVDLLLAGTREESLALAIAAASEWSIGETFPESITARRMDDYAALPHYPYRDDGLLLWAAIQRYVGAYLALYYRTKNDVVADLELQAWASELALSAEGGGAIKGMPSPIPDLLTLVQLVTTLVFELSVGHSAINYPQYPYLGFSPNAPLAGYADPALFFADPPTSEGAQLSFLLSLLPPNFAALGQIAITNALSVYRYDQLGDYGGDLVDPMARQTLYEFVQDLHAIERVIEDRNTRRLVPYTFMLPSLTLNGASI